MKNFLISLPTAEYNKYLRRTPEEVLSGLQGVESIPPDQIDLRSRKILNIGDFTIPYTTSEDIPHFTPTKTANLSALKPFTVEKAQSQEFIELKTEDYTYISYKKLFTQKPDRVPDFSPKNTTTIQKDEIFPENEEEKKPNESPIIFTKNSESENSNKDIIMREGGSVKSLPEKITKTELQTVIEEAQDEENITDREKNEDIAPAIKNPDDLEEKPDDRAVIPSGTHNFGKNQEFMIELGRENNEGKMRSHSEEKEEEKVYAIFLIFYLGRRRRC